MSQEVTFTTKDDEIPEANETFLIKAIVTTGDETAEVIPPEVRLTILANDDSGGVFSVANVRKRLKSITDIKTFVSTRTALTSTLVYIKHFQNSISNFQEVNTTEHKQSFELFFNVLAI